MQELMKKCGEILSLILFGGVILWVFEFLLSYVEGR